MIHFNLSLSNPFIKDKFKDLFFRAGRITENKSWEFQIYNHSVILIETSLDINFRESHAGLRLQLGLFGYSINFGIMDNRHWNNENNCWEK